MSTSTSMSSMSLIFTTSTSTPLFFSSWAPSTTGQYAGTCIFVITLAFILQALLTSRSILNRRWLNAEIARQERARQGRRKKVDDVSVVLSSEGTSEDVVIQKRRTVKRAPWRLYVDLPRALLDTLVAFVGYLLMITVMTANTGYFLSVLAGTYLGSIVTGRYRLNH